MRGGVKSPPFFKAASKRGQRVLAHSAEQEQTREDLMSSQRAGTEGRECKYDYKTKKAANLLTAFVL